jgi:predicted  nucleic acid-binding Zn-ribbon protein
MLLLYVNTDMEIKNYLILKNYHITDSFFLYQKGISLEEKQEEYNRMEEILKESANRYLKNLDKIIVDRNVVSNDQEMFKHHMFKLIDRYDKRPCNILYCDLDVVFIKPVDVFNKIDMFAMSGCNCGIRYYPYGKIYKEQRKLLKRESKSWDTSQSFSYSPINPLYKWDREQDIYQKVVGDQGMTKTLLNTVVHQAYDEYRGGSIIHCNGSSNNRDTSITMQKLYEFSLNQDYDSIKNLLHSPPYDRQNNDFPAPKWSTEYKKNKK